MAIQYSFVPEDIMGKGIERTRFFALSTGQGAVSKSTLENDFFHNITTLPAAATEGTAALWVTEPGRQRVTFSITSWEPDFDQDTFKIWDGEKLLDLTDRAIATNKAPDKNRWFSEDITLEFDTVADEWGILALDTGDRGGTSQIRIKSVEWLGLAPPQPDLGSLYETSPEPLTVDDLSFYISQQVGAFDDPLTGQQLYDERDAFNVPLGWGEAVEGWIALPSGSEPVQLNIYEDNNLTFSEVIGSSSPVGFNFDGGNNQIEILPIDSQGLAVYNLGLEVGQGQYW